jgi:hypothetical protein
MYYKIVVDDLEMWALSLRWVWVGKEIHTWASKKIMSYLPQMIVFNRFYAWHFNVVAFLVSD